MAEDNRKGRSIVSETITLPSGATEPATIFPLRSEETVAPSFVRIDYRAAGTVEEALTLYDEEDGTGSAELTDDLDQFFVSGGDEVLIEDPVYEDITEGLIVEPDGDGDAEIVVTVGGVKVTG